MKAPKPFNKSKRKLSFVSSSSPETFKSISERSNSKRWSIPREPLTGLKICDVDKRNEFLKLLESSYQSRIRMGIDIAIGVNSVSKWMEIEGKASVVCLARDVCPDGIHDYIIKSSQLRNVPILSFPKLNEELSRILRVKSSSCLAVVSQRYYIAHCENNSHKLSNDENPSNIPDSNSINNGIDVKTTSCDVDLQVLNANDNISLVDSVRQAKLDALRDYLLKIF